MILVSAYDNFIIIMDCEFLWGSCRFPENDGDLKLIEE